KRLLLLLPPARVRRETLGVRFSELGRRDEGRLPLVREGKARYLDRVALRQPGVDHGRRCPRRRSAGGGDPRGGRHLEG
ncbi:Os08g0487050, partial [Oryza sativa Japonica Group]